MNVPVKDSNNVQVDEKDVATAALPTDGRSNSIVDNAAKVKRIFNFNSLFAFALTFMATWEGMCTNMYFALYNGGPQVFVWSILVAWIGALAQAASLAEMASIQPIAGAQYHWTWAFAPRKIRRFTTWLQGWLTWFGWISLLCGIQNVNAGFLLSLVSLCQPSYIPKVWHTTLTIFALAIAQALVNIFAFSWLPMIEIVAGVGHVVMFVVFICVLAAMGTKHSGEYVWTHMEVSSGWQDNFVAWNVGMLTCTWSFTGFDGSIHMSEETRRSRDAVPKAMLYTIALNGLLAYGMVIAILFSSGSLQDDLASDWPIFVILLNTTGSIKGTAALLSIITVISFAVGLASTATVSRLTWAWGRDGGIPAVFSHVNEKLHVPVQAVMLPTLLVMLLALLGIGSSAAFGAIIALSSLALFVSYFIAIACMMWSRYSGETPLELGSWNLGRWGPFINGFALLYTAWVMVFLPWPSTIPVTGANMNYAGPIFMFCVLFALASWILWARRRWTGLNVKVVDYVLRSEG